MHENHEDGIDRRGTLRCMAWVGSGLLWSVAGGLPTSRLLRRAPPFRWE
jgi:hypothetical protein